MLLEIFIATLIVSLFAFVGLIIVYNHKEFKDTQIKWIISLAAGALLSVTFLDLLPEAIEESDPHPIMLAVLITFLAFFLLERILHWHNCHNHGEEKQKARGKQRVAFTNLFGDAFHNLIDGFLIASAFLIDFHLGFITTIAVILHEIPQEIADFGVLLYAGYSRKRALFLNFMFALSVILGGIVFFFFGKTFESSVPFMAAIAAGTFIYLAAADLIPELHHEKNSRQVIIQTIWLLAGVLVMYIVGLIVPHAH